MDACNHRLRDLGQGDHHPAAAVEKALLPALVLRVSTHLLKVMTRAEALTLGGEDHNPYRGVVCDRIQLCLNAGDHLVGQGIESLGTAQGQGCDSVRDC